jgi:hypothetical protein
MFGMEMAYPVPLPLNDYMADKAPIWNEMVRKYGLQPIDYKALVSWPFGDFHPEQRFGQYHEHHHASFRCEGRHFRLDRSSDFKETQQAIDRTWHHEPGISRAVCLDPCGGPPSRLNQTIRLQSCDRFADDGATDLKTGRITYPEGNFAPIGYRPGRYDSATLLSADPSGRDDALSRSSFRRVVLDDRGR